MSKAPPELELAWGTVAQATLPELITVAAANGFSSIAVTPAMYFEAGVSDRELRSRLTDAGVRVGYIDGLASALPGATPTPVETGGEDGAVRAAEALGCPAINVMHYRGKDVERPRLVDALNSLGERLQPHDLQIYIEFLPGTGIGDVTTTASLIGMLHHPAVITLDTLHLHRSGGTAADITPEVVALLGATQISDRALAQDAVPYVSRSNRLLPGEGDLDLTGVVSQFASARPDVALGLEVFSDRLSALPANEAARLAARSLRTLVDSLAD